MCFSSVTGRCTSHAKTPFLKGLDNPKRAVRLGRKLTQCSFRTENKRCPQCDLLECPFFFVVLILFLFPCSFFPSFFLFLLLKSATAEVTAHYVERSGALREKENTQEAADIRLRVS